MARNHIISLKPTNKTAPLRSAYHVWFEQPAQHGAEHFEAEESAFSVALRLFVLNRFRKRRHDVQLLQRQDAQSLDEAWI